MNVFGDFLSGFLLASTLPNLGFAFIGCLCGTLIGVLPGIGPLATISVLLSLTTQLDALSSLIMLAGIYYGAQYGGSTTAILCNLPGEATSVMTCIDGNQMALQGRAGAALATAALSSLFAGVFATFVIVILAPPLARFALNFNSPEYFALMLLGLVSSVVLSPGDLVKAFAMMCLGILLGMVGTDLETGGSRYTFNVMALYDGIGVIGLVMGLFGLAEIIRNLSADERREIASYKWRDLWLTWREFRQAWPAALAFRSRLSPPIWRRSGFRERPNVSAAARSKAWPLLRPRTTPRRRPPSSLCSRSASLRTRSSP
jgi:TctA family transporter